MNKIKHQAPETRRFLDLFYAWDFFKSLEWSDQTFPEKHRPLAEKLHSLTPHIAHHLKTMMYG